MSDIKESSNDKIDSANAYVTPAGDLEGQPFDHHVTNKGDEAGLALVEEMFMIPKVEGYKEVTTTRWERWAFYLYYAGNSGLGPSIMAPGLMQSYMYDAAYDPSIVPHVAGNCDEVCYLDFAGSSTSLTSVVLDASGIQFAIQIFIAIILGGWLDYTPQRRQFVIFSTLACAVFSMCWVAIKGGDQWLAGMGINIASNVTYNLSFTYFQAALTGLADDAPEIKQAKQDVIDGNMSPSAYAEKIMLLRNWIGNIGYMCCGFGPFLIALPAIGFIKAMHPNDSEAANERAYRIILAYYGAMLVACCAPWFFLEQRRPPNKLPPNTTYFNVGFKNYWETGKHILKLKQTLLYLLAVVFLSESLNTCSTITYNLQYAVSSYDLPTTNYMTLMSYGVQGVGTGLLFLIQQKWKFPTRIMLLVTSVGTLLCIIWGFIGIWTPNFGFKNLWEIWLFNAWFGFAMCPYFQMSYTMIAEVSPPSKIFMFWSFFALFGKSSAFVGPFITSAIIDRMGGNGNGGYAFLLPVNLIGIVILYFVDTEKSSLECKAFTQSEARDVFKIDGMAHLHHSDGKEEIVD